MSIAVKCSCGRMIRFSDEWAGMRRKCFYCGQEVDVPAKVPPPPLPVPGGAAQQDELQLIPPPPGTGTASTPSSEPGALIGGITRRQRERRGPNDRPVVSVPAGGGAWNRRYLYLSLALIPLLFAVVRTDDPHDVEKRLETTLSHLSESEKERIQKRLESDESADLVMDLPGHRIEGAHLGRDTWMHWVYAMISAGAFLTFLIVLFPSQSARPQHLVCTGLFTGTVGIFLLLAFQYAAFYTQGVWVRGRGLLILIFLIVKFIGFSYSEALNPDSGFLLSCMGFTCGVGFCEEICKMLPLAWHFRSKAELDWRGACLWGLASGVGFGVSEGITYSSDYYNGIHTGEIYLVRFVSCVGLHAIWGGAAGISLYYRQYALQAADGILHILLELLQIVAVPMILHGLYDTLLKKEMEGLAFLTAVASFGWLAYQVERMRKLEVQAQPAPAL